jgi:uncharacterized protein YdeI (YjbR/CyaY-like superfamily)
MKKNPVVDEFMAKLKNPLKDEMEAVREIILKASQKISEDIKWAAPTFIYKGNICSFNPRAKNNVSLVFHKGALIHDKTGLLEGEGKEARVVRLHDMAEIKENREKLAGVIIKWIELMDKTP